MSTFDMIIVGINCTLYYLVGEMYGIKDLK